MRRFATRCDTLFPALRKERSLVCPTRAICINFTTVPEGRTSICKILERLVKTFDQVNSFYNSFSLPPAPISIHRRFIAHHKTEKTHRSFRFPSKRDMCGSNLDRYVITRPTPRNHESSRRDENDENDDDDEEERRRRNTSNAVHRPRERNELRERVRKRKQEKEGAGGSGAGQKRIHDFAWIASYWIKSFRPGWPELAVADFTLLYVYSLHQDGRGFSRSWRDRGVVGGGGGGGGGWGG